MRADKPQRAWTFGLFWILANTFGWGLSHGLLVCSIMGWAFPFV